MFLHFERNLIGSAIRNVGGTPLWRKAQGHMGVLHPELVGNVSREDIIAQAELI
jgi:hypothetical protein